MAHISTPLWHETLFPQNYVWENSCEKTSRRLKLGTLECKNRNLNSVFASPSKDIFYENAKIRA